MYVKLFLLYGRRVVQDVENFFGNVKDVRRNTYYELDTTISHANPTVAIKQEIRFCLLYMSQHPKVDPLPSQKEGRDIWTFENEHFKYTYGNTSG